MYLSQAKISTYKNFLSTNEIQLTAGMNVIVGQNNAGKTALLEALSLQFQNHPHRSLATVPTRSAQPPSPSKVEIELVFEERELLEILADRLQNGLIPYPDLMDFETARQQLFDEFMHGLIKFRMSVPASSNHKGWFVVFGEHARLKRALYVTATREDDKISLAASNLVLTDPSNTVGTHLGNVARERIYLFRAERMNIGMSAFGANSTLKPNASNLPEVLNILQANKTRFERYNEHVSSIFPHIHQIAVRPLQSQLEIVLWTVDTTTEREDLTIPLSQSGTGISQVLAILYVAMTAPFPQVILIDEPQSFLHPGAVRKLLEILRLHYPTHQYILTTHSPNVVSSTDSGSLLLVQRERDFSTVRVIDRSDAKDMQQVLADVGVRLSDVFGADSILWVEGPTEERCFPLILSRIVKVPLLGTTILAVEHTGDFGSRKSSQSTRAFALYERLSSGSALLPPALAFIFDREHRSEQETEDWSRRAKEKVHFLSRRLYENYLLDPRAIASVTSSLDGFRDSPVSEDEVSRWIEDHRTSRKYFSKVDSLATKTTDAWHIHIHGAKFLEDMFAELSEQRIIYRKTQHSPLITEWLIDNNPMALAELADLLKGILTGHKVP